MGFLWTTYLCWITLLKLGLKFMKCKFGSADYFQTSFTALFFGGGGWNGVHVRSKKRGTLVSSYIDRVWLNNTYWKLQVNNTIHFFTFPHNNVGNLNRAKDQYFFDSREMTMFLQTFEFNSLPKTKYRCFKIGLNSFMNHHFFFFSI